MNFVEKKNIIYRVIASILILISTGVAIFSIISVINGDANDKLLAVIATMLVAIFSIVEVGITIVGWKKELSIYKVAFNDNGKINNVFAFATMIASIFGLILFSLAIALHINKPFEPYTTSTLVLLSISLYLIVNCIAYFVFLVMYKKRELNLKKFIK